MSENDPDPYEPDEGQGTSMLGGRRAPTPVIRPTAGSTASWGCAEHHLRRARRRLHLPGGRGSVDEEENAPPVADPGPDA
ncbi:hypothetical protein [Blastococcus brunescens]|uniref:Uncharacterized protein n=1 Tax=Blastococcus brunescens TaxID=1564165 RepID=A0ABZ1AV97_9ACTN|nr:hypothetical protein [Blastococcus sp. BMG 8361]WRL62505.1 hypothetical protein U6N30_21240 [Blastococcus sp. BMG 8361]